jgi:glycosyltransferase involved in cell wall biosynthesis
MKIGIIAPLYYTIPPKTYGGTEEVVYHLTEGLFKNKHKITLFTCRGSNVSAKLDPNWNRQIDIMKVGKEEIKYQKKRLEYIISISDEFDIIHNNDGISAILNEDDFKCPIVTTWHSPFYDFVDKNPQYLKKIRKSTLVSISDSQRKGLPGGNFIATVYNGTVDFEDYKFNNGGDYMVWIGRFNQTKGVADAIKIAKNANQKLVLAGSITSENQKEYFHKFIKDKIDSKQINFVGEVNLEQKVPLLMKAKAFLMPIHWEEPFGLVMIEAMACGTPVIAYNRGSVPEIIEDGKNGYIVEENDIDGMVNAVKNIGKIDRKYCRESVKKRFSIEKMVSGYEKVYKKVIAEYKK